MGRAPRSSRPAPLNRPPELWYNIAKVDTVLDIFDAEYDFVASLGYDCHCATMLRKFGLRSCSSPLDWLTAAPLDMRLKLVERFCTRRKD